MRIAEEHGLDLVEVAPLANPPVCKIMDFGKYRYQLSKKTAKHKVTEVKEIKVRPQIDEHDLDLKIRTIERFLKDGNKAKVTMMFRGREIVHSALSRKVFERITDALLGKVNIEQMPKLEGHHMTMVLAPKTSK